MREEPELWGREKVPCASRAPLKSLGQSLGWQRAAWHVQATSLPAARLGSACLRYLLMPSARFGLIQMDLLTAHRSGLAGS